nr:hypothetical protein [uncultured Massilia sp.]
MRARRIDAPETVPVGNDIEHAEKERKRIGQRAVEIKNNESIKHVA